MEGRLLMLLEIATTAAPRRGPRRRSEFRAVEEKSGRRRTRGPSREEPAGRLAAYGWRADPPALPTIDASPADFPTPSRR
jgi:hypothetical protein